MHVCACARVQGVPFLRAICEALFFGMLFLSALCVFLSMPRGVPAGFGKGVMAARAEP